MSTNGNGNGRKRPQRLVVVGNGLSGVACVEQILRRAGGSFEITIFGDETHVNYNRTLLSKVLAGEKQFDEIALNPLNWYIENGITLRLGIHITAVDMKRKVVIGDDRSVTRFDKLLLSTGSLPSMPPIVGLHLKRVRAYRNMEDQRRLGDWSGAGHKAVVIGGGLLGLEAANALRLRGCDVTVVQRAKWLMERQLDATGGGYLKAHIEKLGIAVLVDRNIQAILGEIRAQAVQFDDGSTIPADFVVIAAGIRPNVELGRMAGLEVNRGIVVNNSMQTSHPDIFAVGECVEHRGVVFGVADPLFAQGKVIADRLAGDKNAIFEGSIVATKLNVVGVEVFSAGEIGDTAAGTEAIQCEDPARGTYKKLVLRNGRLAGVVLVGDASDSPGYLECLRNGAEITKIRPLFPKTAA